MSKRGRERDEEPKATQMPTSWNLRQTVLPSVPIAVFNRCTLHRLDDSTFLLNGIDDRDPSLTIEIQGQSGPVLYASMQDDPSSPALLLFIFETRVVVVSSITGEIVYDKPNPEATSGVIVQETVVFATAVSIIVDHLALTVDPICIEMTSPVVSRLGTTIVAAYLGIDGQLHIDQIDVMESEVPRNEVVTTEACYGPPIAMSADTTDTGETYVRVLCSRGLVCCMGEELVKMAGQYSDEGIIQKGDGTVCLVLMDENGTLEIANEQGRTETYLYPCNLSHSSITVKALSSHTGYFCSGTRQLSILYRSRYQ